MLRAPVGLLRTQLGWVGPTLRLESAFVPSGAAPLSITADLPYALSLADSATFVRETDERYDVRLTARNLALATFAPLLDPHAFLPRAGVLDADAHFEGRPGAQHYNPIGSVHGGYAATLLDSCMACAVQSTLAQGFGYTTLEFKISLVRGMTCDTGLVRATGTVLTSGRRIATAEGRLVDGQGRLIATGTTTCLVLEL